LKAEDWHTWASNHSALVLKIARLSANHAQKFEEFATQTNSPLCTCLPPDQHINKLAQAINTSTSVNVTLKPW
jgi:hypothetical protein